MPSVIVSVPLLRWWLSHLIRSGADAEVFKIEEDGEQRDIDAHELAAAGLD